MKNGRLIVLSGQDRGRTYRLRQGASTIGSAPDCDIVVEDRYVAAQQAEILHHDDGTYTVRQRGFNPIYLDEVEVVGDSPLIPGVRLRLGPDVEIEFQAEMAPVAAEAEPGAPKGI